MADACPAQQCAPVIKRNFFVNINGSAFTGIVDTADCSRGIVLLTDDAGLLDVNDAGLGTFLSTENRIRLVTSFSDAANRFAPCTSTYDDLQCFFNMPIGKGSRPPFIYVGYVDRANGETLTDAFQEIIKCPTCFWNVVPTMYNTDGDGYFDTVELLDLARFIRTDKDYDIKVPTIQASIILNNVLETTSNAAVVAATDHDPEFILSSYYCDVERDANCDPVLNPAAGDPGHNANYDEGATIPMYKFSNDALIVAGIAASYSAENDTLYNFTEYLKPKNFGSTSCSTGRFLDETTLGGATPPQEIQVTEAQVINATGINGLDGSFVPGASRSVSLFIKTESGITYVESLRVNRKQFADVWYKEKAINDDLREETLNFMAGRDSLGLSSKEQRALASVISLRVLDRWVSKQAINPAEYDWAANGYENIIIEQPGYVVNLRPINQLTDAQISQRRGYLVGVCFIVNEPQHRININICEFAVDNAQIERA